MTAFAMIPSRRPRADAAPDERTARSLRLRVGEDRVVRTEQEVDVVPHDGRGQVRGRAERDDAGRRTRRERSVQAERQLEVAEVVRRELELPPSAVCSSGVAITPALLTTHVQRALPGRGERGDRGAIREIEVRDASADLGSGTGARIEVAHGERDLRACTRERARRLDPDPRSAAGDKDPLPGEIDALDDLRGGRAEPERCRDPAATAHGQRRPRRPPRRARAGTPSARPRATRRTAGRRPTRSVGALLELLDVGRVSASVATASLTCCAYCVGGLCSSAVSRSAASSSPSRSASAFAARGRRRERDVVRHRRPEARGRRDPGAARTHRGGRRRCRSGLRSVTAAGRAGRSGAGSVALPVTGDGRVCGTSASSEPSVITSSTSNSSRAR